ncbi:MAG: hypothetical protein RMJ87_13975 [Cytophagales bacterium]|nr:hypothetical protein [Bernardetiaceae bacterium]MDW8206131.1 hypothetical protein [Cytophagales bacterium]
MNNKGTVAAVIAVLLATTLIAGAIWVNRSNTERDQKALKELRADLDELANRYDAEISHTQSGFPYPNVDSVRVELTQLAEALNADRTVLSGKSNEALAKLEQIRANKALYERRLNDIIAARDRNTGSYIGDLRGQLAKTKADLDEAMKKNRSLSAQLSKTIKLFRGAQKELEALKAEKARFDQLYQEQTAILLKLDSVIAENEKLRDALAAAESIIKQQEEQIRTMQARTATSIAKRVVDFRAKYLFRRGLGRDYDVELKGQVHNAGRVEKITVSFRAGDQMFDDGADRTLYITLYRNGQPYRFINVPVTPAANGTVTREFEIKPKLEAGKYTFRVTYQNQQVMDDYNFEIR